MKQDRRGSWYLLTGVVLGIAVGLAYSWVVSPVRYVDAPPSALRADYKDDYRVLVAAAYLYSQDLVRAEDRLAQLKDEQSAKTLAMQAQRALVEGHSEEEIYALNTLASALNGKLAPDIKESTPLPEVNLLPLMDRAQSTSSFASSTSKPTSTPANSPIPTGTTALSLAFSSQLTQSSAPSATPGAPFTLEEKKLICDANRLSPILQVEVLDAADQPVPSIEVVVRWESGEDRFFTGLQPELGLGYADFTMSPGVDYFVHLAGEDTVETDLIVPECVADDDSRYWGSWYLIFTQT